MIRKITLLVLLLFSIVVFSQDKIELTPKGIKSLSTGEGFVVVNFENISKEILYTNSLLYISSKYEKPKNLIKFQIENNTINYKEKVSNRKITKHPALQKSFQRYVYFNINLSFKDNAVKFEVSSFDLGSIVFEKTERFTYPIWDNDNGKLLLEDEKNNIELVLNEILNDYTRYIKEKSNDKW